MSYQPGRMGIAEGTALLAALTSGRAFLSTPVEMLECGAGLAWLLTFIATLAALLPTYIFIIYVNKNIPGDIVDVTRRLLGKIGTWVVVLYYVAAFLFNAASLLRQFAESTLLTALPFLDFHLAIFSYATVAALAIYWGIEGLARAAYATLPFGFGAFIVLFALLIPTFNVHNLLPWQGTGVWRVIKEGLRHAGASTGAMILVIMAPMFQNFQTLRTATVFGMIIGGAMRTSLVLVFILVFGVQVGREKVIPFYEMARLVYLSRFIQHIEALFIIMWVIAGVFSIAASMYASLYLLVRLFKLPAMQPIIPVVTVILVELAQWQPDVGSVIKLDNQAIVTWLNIGIYVIPTILIIATFWQRKRGKVSCNTDA